jgi:integrase
MDGVLSAGMRGHISRRRDAWRVHVYLGVDARTGKQRYLTRTVHGTKRDAEAVCAQLVAEASRGEHGETAAGTLADLVDRWFEHITPNVSPSTLAGYRIYLDKHILPALGAKRIDRLRPADIDRFYASLRGSLAPASVRKVHTILRSALGQAVKWRMLTSNPVASATPPRVEKRPIEPPTPEEVGRLLAAAAEADPELGLYVRLAAITGARRGELCAIRWTDLDLDAGQLVVARSIVLGPDGIVVKATKTNRVRRVALDAGTVAALRSQRTLQNERAASCRMVLSSDAYVFARDEKGREPWRPDSSATGRFMALRDRLDLGHVRLHDLRHYVATRLLDAGVPVRSVSERLGHASATTTLTIYAAAVPATDRVSADILGGLLDDPEPNR